MSVNEDRIASLENQVRRQRRWNIALGAAVMAGGLMAATSVRTVPDVIQAKKFEVVNDEGTAVVTLRSSKGSGVIMNHDHMGRRTFIGSNTAGKDSIYGDREGEVQLYVLNADRNSRAPLWSPHEINVTTVPSIREPLYSLEAAFRD